MSIVKRFLAPLVTLVRLHLLAIIVIAILVLLYTVVGFFAVPRIARAQLESYVTEQLHRQVSVGEIRFNPFAFDTSIAGLTLREADGSPVVSFRHLYVNAQLASVWQRAVVLQEVELSAPDINAIIAKDGTVNLAKLAPPESEEASTERANGAAESADREAEYSRRSHRLHRQHAGAAVHRGRCADQIHAHRFQDRRQLRKRL